jgi:hypothetical protein
MAVGARASIDADEVREAKSFGVKAWGGIGVRPACASKARGG